MSKILMDRLQGRFTKKKIDSTLEYTASSSSLCSNIHDFCKNLHSHCIKFKTLLKANNG